MRQTVRMLMGGAALCAGLLAHAGEVPFSSGAFEHALAAGQPVVVDFAASWCPTCKAQKPLVQGLVNEPGRRALTLFVADFDTEQGLRKRLGVTMQSTLVAFRHGKEVARSTGQTDKAALAALLDKAL